MLFSILPPAARALGITPFQVSTIFAVSASIWVFVSPWWGRLSDVRGRRPVILIGLLGYALSMSLLGDVIRLGARRACCPRPRSIRSWSRRARVRAPRLGHGSGVAGVRRRSHRSYEERAGGGGVRERGMGLGETLGPAWARCSSPSAWSPPHLSRGSRRRPARSRSGGCCPRADRRTQRDAPRAVRRLRHPTGASCRSSSSARALQAVRATTTHHARALPAGHARADAAEAAQLRRHRLRGAGACRACSRS